MQRLAGGTSRVVWWSTERGWAVPNEPVGRMLRGEGRHRDRETRPYFAGRHTHRRGGASLVRHPVAVRATEGGESRGRDDQGLPIVEDAGVQVDLVAVTVTRAEAEFARMRGSVVVPSGCALHVIRQVGDACCDALGLLDGEPTSDEESDEPDEGIVIDEDVYKGRNVVERDDCR